MISQLDREIYDELKRLLGDKFASTVGHYLVNSDAHMADIATGLAEGAADKIANAAHPLKSSSAMLGLEEIAGLSEAIENAAEDGFFDEALKAEIENHQKQLVPLYEEARAFLSSDIGGTGAGVESSPQKIMHVDDDKVVRQITEKALKDAGYEVYSCDSGKDAVAHIKDFSPDLILLDFVMPEMGGPRTASVLKGLGSEIPIIFLTGKDTVEHMEEYKHRHVIGFIHKPYQPEDLVDQIREIYAASDF